MSKFYKEPIHTKVTKKETPKQINSGFETPFKISKSSSEEPYSISVSPLSIVFNGPSLYDTVPIIGLGCPIEIEYGNKIWLETFYDKNLNPLASVLKVGNKWTATTKNISNRSQTTNVYPNELEFISKYDIEDSSRATDIDNTVTLMSERKDARIAELDRLKYFSLISSSEYSAYIDKLNEDYDLAETNLNELKANLNNFFSAAPTSAWKKLFRTYLPLGYTTKNMNPSSAGIDFIIKDSQTQSNSNIPQASRPSSFRLVTCWNNDVLLADYFYENRYPAKIHVPFHRGINYYSINGEDEEVQNTE